MSAVIERFIICDHCGVNFGVDNRSRTIEQQREKAKQDGWTRTNSRDYCGLCSQIRNKGKL